MSGASVQSAPFACLSSSRHLVVDGDVPSTRLMLQELEILLGPGVATQELFACTLTREKCEEKELCSMG